MHLSLSWGLYIKLLPHCRLVQLKFFVLTLPPLLELLNDYIHPHTFVIIQHPSLYLHFLVYLTCVHLHFYLQPPYTILQPHSHIYYQPPSHHTLFINSLLHTLHHNRPCPYLAYHCSAAHILFSTSIWAFPCLFHMVQISSCMEKPTDPLLNLHAQVFTLPHSYQCLMLTSTRLLKRTIMVSSQYNIMCHYVFLLQPINHHTFFHTLHGSGVLLFNIWLPVLVYS